MSHPLYLTALLAFGVAAPMSSASEPELLPAPRELVDDSVRHLVIAKAIDPKDYSQFIECDKIEPDRIDLIRGRTRALKLKETPTTIQVVDEDVVGCNLTDPKKLSLIGRRSRTTTIILDFADPRDRSNAKRLQLNVRVCTDGPPLRLEFIYKHLEIEIHKGFPDSMVHMTLVENKLVVSGDAPNETQAIQILRIVAAQTPREIGRIPSTPLLLEVKPGDTLVAACGPDVINLMRIGSAPAPMPERLKMPRIEEP